MFFKIGVLKNLPRPATLLKKAAAQVFFCVICKMFKNLSFYRTPTVTAVALKKKLLKFSNKDNRALCEIFLELERKTPEVIDILLLKF